MIRTVGEIARIPPSIGSDELIEIDALLGEIFDALGDVQSNLLERVTCESFTLDKEHLNLLAHPLSAHWMMLNFDGKQRSRMPVSVEHQAFILFREEVIQSLDRPSPLPFIEVLCRINAFFLDNKCSSLRVHDVYMSPDRAGGKVKFIDPELVRQRIVELHSTLSTWSSSVVFKSIFSLAVILNIHPFNDGNGRCARTIFSCLISYNRAATCYLPIKAFIAKSQGGFELSLRSVEIYQNWTPLLIYFRNLLVVILQHTNVDAREK